MGRVLESTNVQIPIKIKIIEGKEAKCGISRDYRLSPPLFLLYITVLFFENLKIIFFGYFGDTMLVKMGKILKKWWKRPKKIKKLFLVRPPNTKSTLTKKSRSCLLQFDD